MTTNTQRIGSRPSPPKSSSHKKKLHTINSQNDCNRVANRKRLSIVDSIKIRVKAKLEDVTVELQNDKRSIAVLEVGTNQTTSFYEQFLADLRVSLLNQTGSKSNQQCDCEVVIH